MGDEEKGPLTGVEIADIQFSHVRSPKLLNIMAMQNL